MSLAPAVSGVSVVTKVNFLAFLIVALATGASLPVCHAAASAQIHVSATVPPFISLNAIQNVASYSVSSVDIKRGYLDLPNAISIRLRTNLGTGVPISVESALGEAKVLIKESGSTEFVGTTFTVPTADHRANLPINKSYDSRIVLTDDSKEGSYPLIISLTPAI
jgi:hypothetical protein